MLLLIVAYPWYSGILMILIFKFSMSLFFWWVRRLSVSQTVAHIGMLILLLPLLFTSRIKHWQLSCLLHCSAYIQDARFCHMICSDLLTDQPFHNQAKSLSPVLQIPEFRCTMVLESSKQTEGQKYIGTIRFHIMECNCKITARIKIKGKAANADLATT